VIESETKKYIIISQRTDQNQSKKIITGASIKMSGTEDKLLLIRAKLLVDRPGVCWITRTEPDDELDAKLGLW
jgi:hypothetical protein